MPMSQPRFFQMDEDPWHVSKALFVTLSRHLDSPSTVPVNVVVEKLESLFPSHRNPADEPDGEAVESASTFFWNIWEPFHTIAKQMPHDDPVQEELVACLKAVQASTSPTTPLVQVKNNGFPNETVRLWQDMTSFSGSLWEVADHMPRGEDLDEMFYRNLMSYAARLTRSAVSDQSTFGVRLLSSALEGRAIQRHTYAHPVTVVSHFTPDKDLEVQIALASDWILYAGYVLYRGCKEGKNKDSCSGGPAWTGESGLSIERWRFWKARFGEVAGQEDIDEGTRGLAEASQKRMDSIEST